MPVNWQKIRALRGDRSKDEFAALCRISLATLNVAEGRGARLRQSIVTRIASSLGISADEIRVPAVTPGSLWPHAERAGARLRLEETTSLGLGSSLSAAVSDSGGFDDL